MDVVIVELPAKAKTINKYLGDGYTVLASYGHVRDLPPKDGSVRPDADFAMDWEVDDRAGKHIKAIAEAVRGADRLYLATDPDREGEAISWHVCEVLRQKKALQGSTSSGSFSTKSRVAPFSMRSPGLATSIASWSKPTWLGAPSTTSSDSPCRRCCGASSPAAAPLAACSRWLCG